jgi:hypothetical protein
METKKILGAVICGLMLIATILPVAGTTNSYSHENQGADLDIMRPSGKIPTPIALDFSGTKLIPASQAGGGLSSSALDYTFIKEPTTIMKSYYDYMPSGYTTYPIRLQTENGNGQYLTFHAKPATTGNRRQYYAYVNSTYAIQSGTITTVNNVEGYGSIAIHPATGNPIASWHYSADYTTGMTYDNYDATETAGNWMTPLRVPKTGTQEYIWPVMEVGPSPQGDGYIRVYQVSNNALALPDTLPCEDVRILYTDVPNVNGADLSSLLSLASWHNVTVFTSWRDKECRPFQTFAVDYNHPGKVAFIGDAAWVNGDMGDMPVDEGIFVWESYDYGQTWDTANLHSDGPDAALYNVTNPGFEAPDQLEVTATGYHNTAIYDNLGNLHWTFMQSYGYSDADGSYYFPYFLPQAEIIWDGSSFTYIEVPELPGYDSLSGHSVPWTDSEHLYPTITWSTYPGDAGIFHENKQQQAANLENGWMVQLWADGTYATLGSAGDPNYEEYINHPILFISVSSDNGFTWSQPIELTDIHNQLFNFSQQITVYPYLSDQIKDLGDKWGQISILYFDDNDFGANAQTPPQGPNTGGNVTYCALKIKFPEPGEPVADAHGPYLGGPHQEVQFIGSATGGLQPYNWTWDCGDGHTVYGKNPHHVYSVGTFTAKLTVTDSSDPAHQANDTAVVTVEGTPPVTTCNLTGTIQGGVYISDVKFKLTATDTLAGVDHIMYQLDSGAWTTYSTPVTVTSYGAHTLLYYSVDKANNTETQQSKPFIIYPVTINITGGFGFAIAIKNVGTQAITNINWNASLSGGLVFPKVKEGKILKLDPGVEQKITYLVIGLGKPTITVTAGYSQDSGQHLVLFLIVL